MMTQYDGSGVRTLEYKTHSPALISQSFMPTTYADAINFCEKVAKSDFVPSGLRGKPMDIFLAWQMGSSVGLDFFAAIQNIAVINGRPSLWGDAALAIVTAHPHYENHEEWFEIKGERVNNFYPTNPDLVAVCSILRKGRIAVVRRFSVQEAKQAGLWEKAGVWKNYPQRMLQMRARGFAIRDSFPDALKGIQIREEVGDYSVIDPKKSKAHLVDNFKKSIEVTTEEKQETIDINQETGEVLSDGPANSISFEDLKNQITEAKTVDELVLAADMARMAGLSDEERESLLIIYRGKQNEIK